MSEQRSRRILALAVVWLLIAAAGATLYKLVVAPKKQQTVLHDTGTPSRFKATIKVAHDSFSGYSILRSPAVHADLGERGIRLEFVDDGADYGRRIRALRDGDVQMAVFTVDALIQASARLGEFPGTIVLVIDETRGADAVLAYKDGVRDLQGLDHPDARVLRTPDSPSDTLARVLWAHFDISTPLAGWLEEADGAEDVFRQLQGADPRARRAFVLWEPYVTKALEDPQVHVLLSSADLRGYIVDVLVVQREFLLHDSTGITGAILEAYLRAAYALKSTPNGMRDLVMSDAREYGESITEAQAERLVEGIHWKNTLENYAHFGVRQPSGAGGPLHLEDMVRNITALLVKTAALSEDPLVGRKSYLFYDAELRKLHEGGFHPARIPGGTAEDLASLDPIEQDRVLPRLSAEEWAGLLPVGALRVEPIRFGRGSDRLNVGSKRALVELAAQLAAWPHYYLTVVGHTRAEGDAEANRRLAQARAEAARAELEAQGVPNVRLRATAREPAGTGGEAQSVSFLLGQRAY